MSAPASRARWLVTGGGGQLGRSLAALAPELGIEALVFAREKLDVTDARAFRRALDEMRPQVVLNCAAFTQVDRCEEEPARARALNAAAPAALARAARGRALLVHLSSDYVFTGDAGAPIAEDAPTGPLSQYGRTKLAGEEAVRGAGCEHLIVRTQWLFGPGRNFVRTILAGAARGERLRVVDDQFGRPTWTGALARGLAAAVAGGARGTLHLACEGEASWHAFAGAIVAEGRRRGLCAPVEVVPIPTSEMPRPARRPAHAVLALERAHALGIRLTDWRQALSDYLDAEKEGRDA